MNTRNNEIKIGDIYKLIGYISYVFQSFIGSLLGILIDTVTVLLYLGSFVIILRPPL